ncbi:hypothetical protein ABKV19_020531 [Rosa sericea]
MIFFSARLLLKLMMYTKVLAAWLFLDRDGWKTWSELQEQDYPTLMMLIWTIPIIKFLRQQEPIIKTYIPSAAV